MRLYTENVENYIQSLAASISKDPASLESWKCIHIHPKEPEPLNNAVINMLRNERKDVDCDIVVCPDLDILLISRELNAVALQNFANLIISNMSDQSPQIISYDLFRDWRAVRVLLCSKGGDIYKPIPLAEVLPPIGDIGALRDVFAETKFMRKSRQPQYVLVVEDDLLTRRLVANAFKEQYALITAHNAQEAITNYLMHAPDIVFLDIGLPDASGFAVLRQIVALDPDAYVVMFSGNSYLDNITKALGAGAAGFIAKPFKRDKLRHYIQDSAMHHHKSGH